MCEITQISILKYYEHILCNTHKKLTEGDVEGANVGLFTGETEGLLVVGPRGNVGLIDGPGVDTWSCVGQLGIRQYSHSTSGLVVKHHGHSPVGERQ